MLVLAVNRLRGRRKRRISERADRNTDRRRLAMRFPEDRCAAVRAKVESHRMAAVRAAREVFGFPSRCDILAGEKCRNSKGAAGPPLAFKAMAERNYDWVSRTAHVELPTNTGCKSRCHLLSPFLAVIQPACRQAN